MAEVATAAQMLSAIEAQAPPPAPPPTDAPAPEVKRRLTEQMPGVRKAAILCVSLDSDVVSEVFRYLEEEEVQRISRELASLQHISAEVAQEVLQEFEQLLIARNYAITGGLDYAKQLITKAYGPETARRLLDRVARSLESPVGFETLQKIDPQQLSKLFQNEHPQTIALVLAHLEAPAAAATLRCLPEAQRADIALRIASLQSISQDVIRQISVVLEHKLKSVGNDNRQAVGGVRPVAEICNRLERDVAQKMLEEIEGGNPELALAIRNLMMTFDDLLLVDDMGIRELLQRVDKKMLSLALKGTVPELQNRFFKNMSSRAVEMMKEEMDFMGQVKLKDVTSAQREIVEIMRELDEQGIINLNGSSDGEDGYVS
jgi:flagellar motor switch protein FliG